MPLFGELSETYIAAIGAAVSVGASAVLGAFGLLIAKVIQASGDEKRKNKDQKFSTEEKIMDRQERRIKSLEDTVNLLNLNMATLHQQRAACIEDNLKLQKRITALEHAQGRKTQVLTKEAMRDLVDHPPEEESHE
jgi:septal ring factor EnvC (AmiA/AmiB activator)